MKMYEVFLPYFKQGNDLAGNMEHAESDAEAFRGHAECLKSAHETLNTLASLAADGAVKIDVADTHYISVLVDDTIAERLLDEGIIHRPLFDEEE